MKREQLRALDWSQSSLARLVPCSCLACIWERVVGPGFGCQPESSEFPPGVGLGFPFDLSAFVFFSGLRSQPARQPLPFSWPLPRIMNLPSPMTWSPLPLPLPLPMLFFFMSFAERRCLR